MSNLRSLHVRNRFTIPLIPQPETLTYHPSHPSILSLHTHTDARTHAKHTVQISTAQIGSCQLMPFFFAPRLQRWSRRWPHTHTRWCGRAFSRSAGSCSPPVRHASDRASSGPRPRYSTLRAGAGSTRASRSTSSARCPTAP